MGHQGESELIEIEILWSQPNYFMTRMLAQS